MMRTACEKFRALGRDEDGAALVTTLAMFFFMFVTLAALYTFGTAIRQRIRVQNACDAAAYSAAVVQADTLSRVAVMNRQMAWTYVQMTRRQLDYIVMNMLSRACEHFNSDRDTAEKYAKDGMSQCESIHQKLGLGWYIGANGSYTSIDQMQINGLGGACLPSLPVVGHLLSAGGVELPSVIETTLVGVGLANLIDISKSGSPLSLSGIATAPVTKALAPVLGGRLPRMPESADGVLYNLETLDSERETLASIAKILKSKPTHDSGGLSSVQLAINQLRAQILADRAKIAVLNLAERQVVGEMPKRIRDVVRETLRANLPAWMVKDCRYRVIQEEYPLAFEVSGKDDPTGALADVPGPYRGYFANLHNNHNDERRFLEWAGYARDEKVYKILGQGGAGTAGGIDQWFVRGNGSQRTEGMPGIQRCYKHWDEFDDEAKHNPYVPSCWNKEHLHESPSSVALYCEWQWWADRWFCVDWLPIPIHVPLWSRGLIGDSDCGFSEGPGKDYLAFVMAKVDWLTHLTDIIPFYMSRIGIGAGSDCSEEVDSMIATSPEDAKTCSMKDYKDGCLVTFDIQIGSNGPIRTPFPLSMTYYSRVYADDPHLYKDNEEVYVGECAKPLVLRQSYFGRNGTITVCVACRTSNCCWYKGANPTVGLYSIFNPLGEWIWAFASAKAGYHDPDSETKEDRCYRISCDRDEPDRGSKGKEPWNLVETNWDAVMVPVRKARAQAVGGALSVWAPALGGGIDKWMEKDGWYVLGNDGDNDEKANDVDWTQVAKVPPGMGEASGKKDGGLDWKELESVLFH